MTRSRKIQTPAEDDPCGVPTPGKSVRTALEYACWLADRDHGTRNGKTALYWHLVSVVMTHLKEPPEDGQETNT